MLDYVFESEEKSAAKRAYRQQYQIEREREIEESLRRNHEEKIAKKQAMEQEERLALELERNKLEQLRDAKMRQQLRETRYILSKAPNFITRGINKSCTGLNDPESIKFTPEKLYFPGIIDIFGGKSPGKEWLI